MILPNEYIERMKRLLGEEFDSFIHTYNLPCERGIRVNTLKISVEDFKKISPFPLESINWAENGFYVDGEGLGRTIAHAQGLYYVQEPSAMSVAPKLEVKRGERVLDLCSAPGGKGTQLAEFMHGEGIIFLNEINFSRAKILSSNVERLGVKNAVVTSAPSDKLCLQFDSFFDKILIDAPCSGEGMFRKDSGAIDEWSLENVSKCAKRQAEILENAFKMLCGGGKMVYSTCTFASEEDEDQIADFVAAHPCRLIEQNKLYPHRVRGEGHFYAVIQKDEGERRDIKSMPQTPNKKFAIFRDWEKQLSVKFDNLYFVGDTLYSLPQNMPKLSVQTLRAGIQLGTVTDRFHPSHSLAMCLTKDEAESVELDESSSLDFLRGLSVPCPQSAKGWRLATHNGYPLGWCKCSGGIAKNHLPKGVRI